MTSSDDQDLPLQQFLTYRFSRVQAKLNAQAMRILAQAGLSLTQWRIIALIGNAGQARPSALTSEGLIDKGMFSRKIKPLITTGLVDAGIDDKDNRAQVLSLTQKGRMLYNDTLPIMRKRQHALRAALTEEELRLIYTILNKLELAAEQ